MPHYADGTPAKVGDVVVGQGYNVKCVIAGVVTHVRKGASCTLTVAYPECSMDLNQVAGLPGRLVYTGEAEEEKPRVGFVALREEYGDTKCFRKVG